MIRSIQFVCRNLALFAAIATTACTPMVASFSALGGANADVGAIAGYFAGVSYYAGESGATSVWLGGGSAALGLAGEVKSWQLQCMLAGVHPFTRQQLIQIQRRKPKDDNPADEAPPGDPNSEPPSGKRGRRDRSPGVDVCLTPPKSVAALLAVVSEPFRKQILAALDRAAKRTIEMAETDLFLGRSGKGGRRKEKTKLVVSMFRELVNRNLEPNLHYHCVFSNMGLCRDGKWRTLNTTILRDWARTIGPIFRCNASKELVALGLELEQPKRPNGKEAGWFEIKGVPQALVAHWSSRRAEIEDAVDGMGEKFDDARAQARQHANLSSRKAKQATPPEAELFRRWQEQAAAFGFTAKRAEALYGQVKVVDFETAYSEAWNKSLKRLNHEHAYFSERHLVQLICEAAQKHGIDGVQIARRVRHDLEHSPQIVPRAELNREQQFTTAETWELEKRLLATVEKMKARQGAVVNSKAVERILRKHKHLNAEQQAAVRHLLIDRQAIKVMTGVAGAGKSSSLLAVKTALTKAGYTCLGGALAGAAKEELVAKTGMPSRTLASYLWHLEKSPWKRIQDRVCHDAKQLLRAALGKRTYGPTKVKFDSRTVLFLDECGMLDTKTLYAICRHIEKAKGTIVLTGDVAQLPPILAGGPFARVAKEAGQVHLSKNERQQDERDRQAVADLRAGRADAALRNYANRGRLTIGENKLEAIEKLVATWSEQGGLKRPKEHVIFTQTRKEAQSVNRHCQQERQRFGNVRSFGGLQIGDERIFIGDRVLFHKPLRTHGIGIENGYRATVLAVNPILRTVTVRLDHTPPSLPGQKPRSQTVTVPLRKLGADGVTLGYAATTHKMQGQTCDHSYVLIASRLASKEMAYVQATRGRHSTQLWSTRAHAGRDLTDLVESLKRSVAKNLAHDLPDAPKRKSRPALRQEITREL